MRSLPIAVLSISFAFGCGSSPLAPSPDQQNPSPSPTPAPSAPQPPAPQPSAPLPVGVRAENVVYLPPPSRPADSGIDPIVGRYTLEIVSRSTSGLRCEGVPPHARRRVYTADINSFRDYYAVSLYEATFLKDGRSIGYGCSDRRLEMAGVCHQFIMRRGGEDGTVSVEMNPEDEWRGAEIWEVLIEEGRLLQLHGLATGTARSGRIEAVGSGGIWYGTGLPAPDYSACSGEMAWTFTRR
jgi:hypothetical protein